MSVTPPILPSPDGWRQPAVLLPWAPRRLAVAGLLFSVVVVWYAIGLSVAAWQACDIVSAGQKFGLVTVVFPALALVMWVIFSVGAFVTRSLPMFARFQAGATLVVIGMLFLVTVEVPKSDYRFTDHSEYPECGPGGVPTWWPAWLPS